MAGINAARFALGLAPVVLPRESSYIATMIDDLVTKDIRDPYRMLTSRSEYRLLLRQDNADQRLTPIGRELGLVTDERFGRFSAKMEAIARERAWLRKVHLTPGSPQAARFVAVSGQTIEHGLSAEEVLRRPDTTLAQLLAAFERDAAEVTPEVAEQLAIEVKYEGYIKRQQFQVERAAKLEHTPIPEDLDYYAIKGLSRESQDKLHRIRPQTVGQAAR